MDQLIKQFCPRLDFDSYEDFVKNYTVNVPEDFNFGFDVVDYWAEHEPDKRALLYTNDTGVMETYTFADIKRLSDKTANVFRSLGIGKGDVVMLILKQRVEAWTCITALCKLGAVCIPATYQLTPKDIVYRCNAADVKMIVCVGDDVVIDHVAGSVDKCETLQTVCTVGDCHHEGFLDFRAAVEAASEDFPRPTGDDATKVTDTMLIYFSSGTTGMPKMVLHDHSLPLGHIVTARFWHQVQENTVHLTQTDSGWAKFAWGKIYGQWICGACIGVFDTEKFAPKTMLDAIQRLRPTTFCAPATIYRFLIKEDLTQYDFSFIKHASLAGEPLNPEVYHQIERMTGLHIYEGFGQSETSVLLANFGWFPVRPGSMGKPSPIFDIRLLDENGEECEDGIVGTICIGCPDGKRPVGLFRTYYRDAEANQRSMIGDYYSTGDMAWRDSDGYYWFVGRNDDVIKCSGYRIGPFEVESALIEHPSVLECAITAAPDPIRGQVVKATIVLARGYAPSDELVKELQNHVKHATAPYKYPRIVEFVDELPKTTSGKIMRTAIRAADMQKALKKD